jgi:hypothetical protein
MIALVAARIVGARIAIGSVCLLAIAHHSLHAQDPTRLPAVVVNAAPDPPGPRKLTGMVRDTSAIPLDSVEVSIPSLQRRAFTKLDGTFLFTDVKPGKYAVRARKLGYAPQIREFTVDSTGGTGAFTLLTLPYVLHPVVTTVARGGMSGVVGDTSFNALAGAEVRVLGHENYTRTDSLGQFYIPIRSGSYMVRVTQPGFADRLVSVIVPPDSGQRIRVTLAPPSRVIPIREIHNIDDFASRLAWRSLPHSRVYTHEDLVRMKIEWVYDAVQMGHREMHVGVPGTLDKDCVAMINGGPDYAEIGKFTVDEVESVEIYDTRARPPGANPRPPAPRPGQPLHAARLAIDPVPLTNTDRASWANMTKACTLVYLWLR